MSGAGGWVVHSPLTSRRGFLTQATVLSASVKCVAPSKQWVTAIEDVHYYQVWLCPCRYKTCWWQVSLCDPIKHGPCLCASVVGVAYKEAL